MSLHVYHQKNGQVIPGGNNATLRISYVDSSDIGSYSVFINNTAGSTISSVATLLLRVPPSLYSFTISSWILYVNDTLTLSAIAEGTGPLQYSWMVGKDSFCL